MRKFTGYQFTGRLVPAAVMGAIFFSAHSSGHDVITTPITFSREISRLVYHRCAVCHRPGGSAFSLLTYAEARPWAKAIKDEVLERRMPPWGAVKGFGEFRDDQGLTQEQLELIADWVEGGAPEGDPQHLPKAPEFAPGSPGSPAPGGIPAGIPVYGAMTLKTALTVSGVRPGKVPEGSSFQAIAERPDGTIEPLLWIYNYQPRFDRLYWFSAPLHFPAGTRIEIAPRGAGSIALLVGSGIGSGHPAARSGPAAAHSH